MRGDNALRRAPSSPPWHTLGVAIVLSRYGRSDENILGLDVAMHDVDGVHWRMQWGEAEGVCVE